MHILRALLATASVALLLTGCSATSPPAMRGSLPHTGRVDYQLGGAWNPPSDVTVVARDRTDKPLAGVYSICYVNGFQSQPQESQFWLTKHADLILRNAAGGPQVDPDWPDEMALDTSTAAKRDALAAIEQHWIDGCRDDGYQAVEFDNLDSYTRFDGITMDDNIAFATTLVSHAHAVGLATGQKNAAELGTRGRDTIGFDFVISEECFVYHECAAYAKVYGDQFIDIEYQGDDSSELTGLCADPDIPFLTIVRDRDLLPGDNPRHVFWDCGI